MALRTTGIVTISIILICSNGSGSCCCCYCSHDRVCGVVAIAPVEAAILALVSSTVSATSSSSISSNTWIRRTQACLMRFVVNSLLHCELFMRLCPHAQGRPRILDPQVKSLPLAVRAKLYLGTTFCCQQHDPVQFGV